MCHIPQKQESVVSIDTSFSSILETALSRPPESAPIYLNTNELIEHTIISGDNFYIPMDDQENVDRSYWVKLISGEHSAKIKFEYTGSNYLYNILDDNLNIIETHSITEDTVLTIGDTVFNLFTGGVGGEDDVNSSDVDNIEDIIKIFNCAVQKIGTECDKLDSLLKILDLRENMFKFNKTI